MAILGGNVYYEKIEFHFGCFALSMEAPVYCIKMMHFSPTVSSSSIDCSKADMGSIIQCNLLKLLLPSNFPITINTIILPVV